MFCPKEARLILCNRNQLRCVSQLGAIIWHGWYLSLIFILIDHGLPGIAFDLINLVEECPLFSVLSLPRVGLKEAQLAHLLMLHQSTFHTALQILHLVVPTTLRNQLVSHHAVGIFLGLVVTLVEVVQWE